MGRKGLELSPEMKNLIVDMHEEGHKVSEICRLLGKPYMTVHDTVKRNQLRGNVENTPREGRPKKVTVRDYRALERSVKSNRRNTLSDITATFNENRDNNVSKRTVQRHLHKNGYHRRVMRKKLVIKQVNRTKRVQWCKERRNSVQQWEKVIFSDESKVVIGDDKRIYV